MTSGRRSGRDSWFSKVTTLGSIRHLAGPLVGLVLSSCASNPLAAAYQASPGILKRSQPNPHPSIIAVSPQEHVKVVNGYLKSGKRLIGFSEFHSRQEVLLEAVDRFAATKDTDIAVYSKDLSAGGASQTLPHSNKSGSEGKIWRHRLALLRLGALPAIASAGPKPPLVARPSAQIHSSSTNETQKTSEETLELKPKISGDR